MRISPKKLRENISENDIPGKFIRTKNTALGYVILTQLSQDEYAVVTRETGDDYSWHSWTPRNLTYEKALEIYNNYKYYDNDFSE